MTRIMVLFSTFQITSVGMSDIGQVREHNEDVWAAFPDRGLFLLADGMGGHAAGEVAAAGAVDHLQELVKVWHPTKQTTPDEAVVFLREAFTKVNRVIYQEGVADPALAGMGTTLCALYFLQTHVVLAHVGDSRIYLLRNGFLEQLTEDHSLVSEMVELGAIKLEESGSSPYKHILTRAIGTHPNVEPTVNYLSVEEGDCYLMCSDGLTNFISDTEIEATLKQETSLQERAHELIALANAHGGGDNITVVLTTISE